MIFARMRLEWRFRQAWRRVRSALPPEERRALVEVLVALSFELDHAIPTLRGYFYGEQAMRDRALEGRLVEGSRARGVIEVFAPRHDGSIEDFVATLRHEVDHALGFNEAEVLQRSKWPTWPPPTPVGPPRKRQSVG